VRIVSLLPATTEILFALGAGDDVVGVTFECDFPAQARSRTIVSTSALPEGLAPAEIDAFVAAALRRGDDLYHLDEGVLSGLDADLVVTQDLCAVCAVDVSVVEDALVHLGCSARVLTLDPHTLDEVLDSVRTLGLATGHEPEADRLVTDLRARRRRRPTRGGPAASAGDGAGVDRPAVRTGHWIPEMVELAGGTPVLGRPGEKSRRVAWAEIREADPDVVVVAPCGYDLAGARALAVDVAARFPSLPVHAVDANASWARPGPRLVDGLEELTRLLHPRKP